MDNNLPLDPKNLSSPLDTPPDEEAVSSPAPAEIEIGAKPEDQKEEERLVLPASPTPLPQSNKTKLILGVVGVLLLLASVPAAVFLVQQRQEIRKMAQDYTPTQPPPTQPPEPTGPWWGCWYTGSNCCPGVKRYCCSNGLCGCDGTCDQPQECQTASNCSVAVCNAACEPYGGCQTIYCWENVCEYDCAGGDVTPPPTSTPGGPTATPGPGEVGCWDECSKGPCLGLGAGGCHIEALSVNSNSSGDEMRLVRDGKLWSWTRIPGSSWSLDSPSSGGDLTQDPVFVATDGPCYGLSAGSCHIEALSVNSNSSGDEMRLVKDGKLWSWTRTPGNTWVVAYHVGTDLSQDPTGVFNAANAPCAGVSAGQCHIEALSVNSNSSGDEMRLVRDGKLWSWTRTPGNTWVVDYHVGTDLSQDPTGVFNAVGCPANFQCLFANETNYCLNPVCNPPENQDSSCQCIVSTSTPAPAGCWSACPAGVVCASPFQCRSTTFGDFCLNPDCPPESQTPSCECITCECLAIGMYYAGGDNDWQPVPITGGVAAIDPDQSVYFTVQGSDSPWEGRFRISTDGGITWGDWQVTTNKHGDLFYIQYTIPSSGSYVVEAESCWGSYGVTPTPGGPTPAPGSIDGTVFISYGGTLGTYSSVGPSGPARLFLYKGISLVAVTQTIGGDGYYQFTNVEPCTGCYTVAGRVLSYYDYNYPFSDKQTDITVNSEENTRVSVLLLPE